MKRALSYIERKNASFARHPMFDYLRNESLSAQQRLVFAPYMAHFVFSFMDINRFVLRDLGSHDQYQQLVNIHTDEDSHHWPWYLNDLKKLELDKSGTFTEWLYFIWSDHGISSRMLTYDMVGLVKQASPVCKIILVEVIEKTGNVFLGQTAVVSRQLDSPPEYLYFGQHHLDCETGHHMGTDAIERKLEAIELTPDELEQGIRLIDDAYTLYANFLTEMLSFAQQHDYADMVTRAAYPAGIGESSKSSYRNDSATPLSEHSEPAFGLQAQS